MKISVLLLSTAAIAVGTAPAGAIPPPPITVSPIATPSGLATWTAGDVHCDGGVTLPGATIRRPLSTLDRGRSSGPPAVTLQFDIDASGRPVSIKDRGFDDAGPALAASRFPAGAHTGCSVTFGAAVKSIASAAPAELLAYSVSPISGRLPPQGWARIAEGGNCADRPRQQPLLRAYPDFRAFAGSPGEKTWSVIAYDTDAAGKPIHVRMLAGNGNARLDGEAVKAVRASRFTGGARTGCTYPYWRAAEPVPAPSIPDDSAFRSDSTACSDDRKWATPPTLRFPPTYGRRRIEGWAVLSYDIAPWGAVGNIKVLASQPADAFGRQAMQMVQSAQAAPSAHGATGCVTRVKFEMPDDEASDDASGMDG